jgi:photosystem II stability/assembly factor-like uncharacterized protein
MKKTISFFTSTVLSASILLSFVISSCAAPAPSMDTQTESPVEAEPAATPTLVDSESEPQSALPPSDGTPLPDEIDAPLIDSPSIINIEMMDEVYGWGITERRIIRTNDGGVTWYDVTPPGLAQAGYSVFFDFLDMDHGWLQVSDPQNYPFGGTLYITADGGMTWDAVETPFSAGDLEFVDADHGWIMADIGIGAGSMAVSVFQTNNGGRTWSRTFTNDPNLAGADESLPLGGIKVMIRPLDMEQAWIGGVIYSSGSAYLFRTDDAGRTWTGASIVLPEEAHNSEIAVEQLRFVSPAQGFLALRMTSTNLQTILYRTDDGGETWELLPARLPGGGFLEIPSAQEIIFYSGGRFHVTKDAGETFEIIEPDTTFGDAITDMSFVNASTGWVITTRPINRRTLYKTTDGGATWFAIIP